MEQYEISSARKTKPSLSVTIINSDQPKKAKGPLHVFWLQYLTPKEYYFIEISKFIS